MENGGAARELVIERAGWTERRPLDRSDLVVGRGEDCDVVLADPAVSRRHCRLQLRGEAAVVEDLGSSSGTWLGGKRIEGQVELGADAVLAIGDSTVRIAAGAAGLSQEVGNAADLLDAFLHAVEELAAIDDLDAALRAIVLTGCKVAGGERGALFLHDREDDDLELVIGVGRDGSDFPSDATVTRTLPWQALSGARAVAIASVRGAAGEERTPSLLASGIESVICVPLPGDPLPVGVLYIDRRESAASFSAAARALLQALAVHASLALERARFRRELEGRERTTRRALDATRERLEVEIGASPIGNAPAMVALLSVLRRVATSEASVCLIGETGTGKGLLVRHLHRLSARSTKPLVVIDCGALPENLIESELMGHERGAFTGAHVARPGRFREADQGTIFLDEIGELPRALQSRLLRVLQEKVVQPIGGRELPVDVRVVAATHRDLKQMVAEGTFREDLYYRLATITLEVPALRDRGDDVLLLAEHYLARQGQAPGGDRFRLSHDARAALLAHGWPGNVRELEHRVQRAVLLATSAYVSAFDLGLRESEPEALPSLEPVPLLPLREARAEASLRFERSYLESILRHSRGSVADAARLAGVSRQALYDLMKRHQVERGDFES